MSNQSRAKELIGYSFLVVFANDDTIDEGELLLMEKLALEDHVVDEDEKKALRAIFDRVDTRKLAAQVSEEINRFREENKI
jgi:hypothetical protein